MLLSLIAASIETKIRTNNFCRRMQSLCVYALINE
ncbi:hypothetical protein DETS111669_32485 [Delftia tsuruhatensis]